MRNRLSLLVLIGALAAQSAVRVLHVKERTDVASGASLPYERILAKAHFVLDPKLPQNRGIVDLDLAPVNAEGLVEFTSDVLVLKPLDPSKGNGTALIDVPNRGNFLSLAAFNRAATRGPGEAGDRFLMDRGFTIVSVGWQWDVPEAADRLGLQAPKLREPVTGLARAEFVPNKSESGFSLGDRDHRVYPPADTGDAANRLFVSDAPGAPRREIPRSRWRFVNKTAVEVDGGCEAGKIYELVYRATDAVPAGLGFAAVRDMASFFKYGTSPMLLGDQRQFIKRTIGFGISQTGRFLRHMMYEGFNQDEKGRKALDGVWAHVAGAGRGSFNHRFAQPSRDGQPHLHYSWPADQFPFADSVLSDPLSGGKGGLLDRVRQLQVEPKMFLTNNSYEYWGRAASLIHTTPDGARDASHGDSVRIYFITGGQHGNGAPPPARAATSKNLTNPLDPRWALRAMLVAMHEWLKDGVEPPASAHPRIEGGELVRASDVKHPKHIQAPRHPRVPRVLDFGAEFQTKGLVSNEPPKEGAEYRILLPQVDADGNEKAGVRLPEVEAPLGAYAGWNFRSAATGSPDRLVAFTGSFFPFSAEEIRKRYGSRESYLARVRKSAESLTARRLLLASDTDAVVETAGRLWDAVASR